MATGDEREPGKGRYWGFWTRGKLDLLRRYLNAFTTASSGVDERIYLDLFGGQPLNRERYTNEILDGSARIALSTDRPPFTRLRFFELEPYATRLSTSLREHFPGRDFEVIPGDCNTTVLRALSSLRPWSWAPTFAFVDPNGPDVYWSTLEALASFKRRSSRTKTEIWLLLAAGLFIRKLPIKEGVRPQDAEKLTRMYGTNEWKAIHLGRVDGDLTPSEAREEYVNLMRWRLESVLGYKRTHPLEIVNEGNTSIYHMIFATDSDAGDRIMSNLYNRAANEFPAMRQVARARRSRLKEESAGIYNLFGQDVDASTAPVTRTEKLYQHEPPWPPYPSTRN